MDITINELGQLTPDSYILLDMRGDVEVGHGIIPGAIHMSKEEILEKYTFLSVVMSKKCFTPSQLNCKLSVWVLCRHIQKFGAGNLVQAKRV